MNIIATPKGGTHVAGFERALVKVMNEQLRATKLLKVTTTRLSRKTSSKGLLRS